MHTTITGSHNNHIESECVHHIKVLNKLGRQEYMWDIKVSINMIIGLKITNGG